MSESKSSKDKGRDSVTDAVDAYLLNGVDAVTSWVGPACQSECLELTAGYMVGCATIHAAELIADAICGLAAALDRATTIKGEAKP